MKHATWFIAASLLSACAGGGASGPTLYVSSNPIGAVVLERGTSTRYLAPVTLQYDPTANQRRQDGCYYVRGFTALWTSGATAASEDTIRLCGSGPAWTIHFERPDGPGIENDLAFAEERQRQMQQAETSRQDSWMTIFAIGAAGALQGYNDAQAQRRSYQPYVPPPPLYGSRNRNVTCTPSLVPAAGTNSPTYTCR